MLQTNNLKRACIVPELLYVLIAFWPQGAAAAINWVQTALPGRSDRGWRWSCLLHGGTITTGKLPFKSTVTTGTCTGRRIRAATVSRDFIKWCKSAGLEQGTIIPGGFGNTARNYFFGGSFRVAFNDAAPNNSKQTTFLQRLLKERLKLS